MRWIYPAIFLMMHIAWPAVAEPLTSTLKVANPRGTIGDMGSMGLWEPGFHLTNENDFLGNTDKLVTQTSSAHINTLNEHGLSFDLAYYWRLVTPISETRIDQPGLEPPIGSFADWEAYETSVAYTKMQEWGGIKLQGTVNYNSMRDNYGKNLLNWAHDLTGAPRADFESSIESWHWGGGGELSYVAPSLSTEDGTEFGWLAGAGWNQSGLMHEGYVRVQLVSAWSRSFKVGVEGSYNRQLYSPIYGSLIKKERLEGGISFTITPYWRTGVKYVSPYLHGDRFGQYYLELIGLNIPF